MGHTRILIVDDFEEDQQELISLIRDAGGVCTFDVARQGDEAVASFETHRHDCVILDYRLEHESGLDILERLKAIDPFCAVIMMSGHGSEKVAADAMKSGAIDYMVKGSIAGHSLRIAIKNTIKSCEDRRMASIKQQEQYQFLNTLVHDIRAPLTNISKATAMLIEDIESGSFDEVDVLVEAQNAAVNHANALIKTLQAYALLDGDVSFERVNFDRVFELVRRMFKMHVQASNATIKIDTLPDIIGHEPQIIQLFQNLISNALKYNESDEPSVDLRLVSDTRQTITVCVEDNGLGIEPKNIEAIFKPLNRLWSKDEYEGTGLGLSICKKIVDRHQGRIWCESQPGMGSKFFVELSRAP